VVSSDGEADVTTGAWHYAPGSGLLFGVDDRWLLLADQPAEAVTLAVWDALSTLGVEQALAVLEREYAGQVPAVATWDEGRARTRGAGSVALGDEDLLTVGLPDDGPWLPVLGGIVAGGAARLLRPVTDAGSAPQPQARHARRLIDGIPDDIASSRGPEIPRRYAERMRLQTGGETQPPAAELIEHPDTGSGSTTRRATTTTPSDETRPADSGDRPAQPPSVTTDHDGDTTFRPAMTSSMTPAVTPAATPAVRQGVDHLRQPTHETVLAVICARGHPTPAYSPECRVCHGTVPAQEPRRIQRPRLGGLRLPSGEVIALDRGVVIGRRPAPVDDEGEWPHLVTVPPEASYVSRVHVHIQLDGWLVIARDVGSRGGTTLRVPGREPESIRAQEPHVLEPGQSLDLADEYEVVYDVTPEMMNQ
jgi:hypothetical protein